MDPSTSSASRSPSHIATDPPSNASSTQAEPKWLCKRCGSTKTGRNLIVSFDGTANQFGKNNTNVIELHDRIIKDKTQLTYYNSGIGTYARPSWRSVRWMKQVFLHKIDLAIAWNFEATILKGYRWLCDRYDDGDQIFLFGFSRGAYQIRALAGMIQRVGLISRGNEEQIPFAYEVYADLKSHKTKTKVSAGDSEENVFDMAERFKKTFSRDVKVHFVGVWDTVSSIGVIRGKELPLTNESEHICYFRHALALDERRVKFLPEYIHGGQSAFERSKQESEPEKQKPGEIEEGEGDFGTEELNRDATIKSNTVQRVKEVWFLGSHSDVGGGNKSNQELNNEAITVVWMGNEALMGGLRLKPSRIVWDWDKLEKNRVNESLSTVWRFFEFLPFKRLNYTGPRATSWSPHLSRGRLIKPGQTVHASVAFSHDGYKPKARFVDAEAQKEWLKITETARKAGKGNTDWIATVGDLLEKDLFDNSAANNVIQTLRSKVDFSSDLTGQLRFISLKCEGAREIVAADEGLHTVIRMLSNEDPEVRIDGCEILGSLVVHDCFVFQDISPESYMPGIRRMVGSDNARESQCAAMTLRRFARRFSASMKVDFTMIKDLSHMMTMPEMDVRLSGFRTLRCFGERVPLWDVEVFKDEIPKFINSPDLTTRVAGVWVIAELGDTKNRSWATPEVFSWLTKMIQANDAREHGLRSSSMYAMSKLKSYDDALDALLRGDTVATLTDMLRNHPPQLQWGAARVFKTFVVHEKFRAAGPIGDDVIQGLLTMLISESDDVRKEGGDTMKALALYEEYRNMMLQTDVMETLVKNLKDPSYLIQSTVVDVLAYFVQYEEFRNKMSSQDVIHSIAEILKQKDVQVTAAGALKPSGVRAIAARALKPSGVRAIAAGALKPRDVQGTVPDAPKPSDVQVTAAEVRAVGALKDFIHYERFRSSMLDLKIISYLEEILKRPGDSHVKTAAVETLEAFAQWEEFKASAQDILKKYSRPSRNEHAH